MGRRMSLWGRGSLRASLCCPVCGLWGDGGMCELCTGGLGDGDTVNSCSTDGANSCHHTNLRLERRPEVPGEMKTRRLEVGDLTVGNTPESASLANYLRWAPRSWPLEVWECRVIGSPDAQMWQRWLAGRCEVMVSMLRSPEWLSKLPGPGESFRSALGWIPLLHTPSSGVWLFWGGSAGEAAFGCACVIIGLGS